MILGQMPMGFLPFTPITANPAPIAVNDDAGTFAKGSNNNTLNVLANDQNVAGGTLTIETQPANGACTVSGDVILYSPNNGFLGADSFVYRITTASGTATATVTTFVQEGAGTPPPAGGTLSATPDTFRMQTGTTKELWVTWNDVRPREAQVTSASAGSIMNLRRNVINYTAPGSPQTVNINYTISDKANSSTTTATVNVVSGTPAAMTQRTTLYIYNKQVCRTRYIRPLQNASGSSVVINSVSSQPAVGSATRLDNTRISMTVPEAAAPQNTSIGYQVGSANGTASGTIDVVVQNKPNVTWATGLLIGIPDVPDWITQIGRNPSANAGFTRLVYKDGGGVQHALFTNFSRLSGDSFTINDAGTNRTVSMFGTPSYCMSNFESGLNAAWKQNAIHFLSVQLVPEDQSVHSSPTGFKKFLPGGGQNSAYTTCWYKFGQRFATYLDNKSMASSKIVLELGKECNSTEPYQILPGWEQDAKDAWRLAVDRIRAGMNNTTAGRADDLRFCFRVAQNRKAVNSPSSLPNLPQLFPGNSHFAVVGMSFHDGESDFGDENGWHNVLFGSDNEFGLSEFYETARQHNVMMAVPEWDLYYTGYSLGVTKEPREVMERWFRWLYEHRDKLLFETYLSQYNRMRDRWTTWGAAQAYKALWSN